MTAYPVNEVEEPAKKVGMKKVIGKPVGVEKLRPVIAEFMYREARVDWHGKIIRS